MRGIIGVSLKFQFLIITIAVVIIAFGVTQLAKMPVDALPEFSPPYVEVQTEALGLSAKEMEQMITMPMEQDLLAGVAWLDVIQSQTVPGLSSVLIYFEPGTDLYKARQMVAERLAQSAVGLPNVSKPPTMIQPHSSASRFMIVGLSSEELSLIEMSVLARWTTLSSSGGATFSSSWTSFSAGLLNDFFRTMPVSTNFWAFRNQVRQKLGDAGMLASDLLPVLPEIIKDTKEKVF